MGDSAREFTSVQQRNLRFMKPVSAFLGWLGAVNMLLLASYILSTYASLSMIPPVTELRLPVQLGVTIFAASAVMLTYGSTLIWKGDNLKGGLVNLMAGSLGPIPTYMYFAFFSQPALLRWAGPFGLTLLAPAMLSGIAGIYAKRLGSRPVSRSG